MADAELRKILRLVGARSLNTFGREVLSATVFWELYERTGTTLVFSAVGFAQVLPVVLMFVPAGTLVDRSDRRTLATIAATSAGLIGLRGFFLQSGGTYDVGVMVLFLFEVVFMETAGYIIIGAIAVAMDRWLLLPIERRTVRRWGLIAEVGESA